MFRMIASQASNCLRQAVIPSSSARIAGVSVRSSHHEVSPEELDERYKDYFNCPDIDGWEIRKGMNDLLGMDLVPNPIIVVAGLKACRRVNDIALAIRWIEAVKNKCGDKVDTIFPYIMEQVKPTMVDLGVPTLEELGYDKPELALKSVYDM